MSAIGQTWPKLKKSRQAMLSLGFLIVVSLMAVFAPWFATHPYDQQDMMARLESPSLEHFMGTDILGRDLYSRIVYGARMSLAVGLTTALIALFLGTTLGAVAGYYGGRVERTLMALTDMMYIFPVLLLAILLMLLMGRGPTGIILAIGLATWVIQARLVRGLTLQLRESPFVEAAQALGQKDFQIIFRHILPNLIQPIIVSLTFQIPSNIMAESFLSFIGLGLRPPYSSWGTLAAEGFRAMTSYPHLMIYPGFAVFFTMLAFNRLGDLISDAADPIERPQFG